MVEKEEEVEMPEVTADQLPKADFIINWVTKIMTRATDDDMVALEMSNHDAYLRRFRMEFKEFADRQPSLFEKILEVDDPSMLIHLIKQLHRVKEGRLDYEDGTVAFMDQLDEEHFYPRFSEQEVEEMRELKRQKLEEHRKKKQMEKEQKQLETEAEADVAGTETNMEVESELVTESENENNDHHLTDQSSSVEMLD